MINDKQQMTMIDILSILSFCISLINLDENLGQSDKQELQNDLSKKINVVLSEIHSHLEEQDKKIDKILEVVSNDC